MFMIMLLIIYARASCGHSLNCRHIKWNVKSSNPLRDHSGLNLAGDIQHHFHPYHSFPTSWDWSFCFPDSSRLLLQNKSHNLLLKLPPTDTSSKYFLATLVAVHARHQMQNRRHFEAKTIYGITEVWYQSPWFHFQPALASCRYPCPTSECSPISCSPFQDSRRSCAIFGKSPTSSLQVLWLPYYIPGVYIARLV